MLQPPMDNRGLRCPGVAVILLVWLVVVNCVPAQSSPVFPVLYPAITHTNFFVEDMASHQLLSGHGALPWFLCSEQGYSNTIVALKQPLPRCRQLVIRTQERYLNLTLSLVNDRGAQEHFTQNPDFKVKQVTLSPKPPTTVVRHRKDKRDPVVASNGTAHKFTETALNISTVKFVVSVGLLKKNLPVLLQISVDGQTRQIMAISDPDPPKASIKYEMHLESEEPIVKSVIQFSEGVVPVSKSSNIEPCDAKLQSLSKAVTFLDMLNTTMSACGTVGDNWAGSIELFGAKRGIASYDPVLAKLKVQAFVEKGVPSDIIIRLRKESFIDLAGNLNDAPVETVVYYRPTVTMPSSERRQRLLRRRIDLPEAPVNTATAAAMGVAASAAAAAAAVASTAASAAGGGGGSGGGGSPIDIIGMAQKMYLTGRMAISEFPENYGAFTEQLSWAMFDISTPWEKAKQRSEELKNENATVTAKGIEEEDEDDEGDEEEGVSEKIESITSILEAQDDDKSPYDHLKRVFFWVPLGYIALLILHSSCLCCCLCKRKPIPDILQFPRLELMFGFWAIPAIAGASAGLYQGKREDALFGTWLLIVFPVSFMSWNVFMLYHHFYSRHPAARKANMVLEAEEPPRYVSKDAINRALKRMKTSKKMRVKAVKQNVWEGRGSNSPVGFVNPAFLASGQLSFTSTVSEEQNPGLYGGEGMQPQHGHSKDLKAQPDWHEDFQNQWRKRMNDNLDGMMTKDRVNNALVIPSVARSGYDDGASDEVDDSLMSSTANSSTAFTPNQTSLDGTSVSTFRSSNGSSHPKCMSMPKELSKYRDPVPEIVEGSELQISVLAPDVPWRKVDLMVIEATQDDQTLKCAGWKERPAGAEPEKEDAVKLRRAFMEFFDLGMVSLFLGRRQQDGEWITTSKTHSKFIARYGPLFEDHRGHPVVRREATYMVDPSTGKLDRGQLIPVKRRPLFQIPALKLPFTNLVILPSKKIYRFQLQILTRLLDFTKVILLACLIEAVDEGKESMNQILALFVVSAINLVVVRIARPFPSRLDMTVTLLAEGADVVTFFLGIILLLGPNHDREFRIKVGKGMLYAEGGAFLSMVLERLCLGAAGLVAASSILKKEEMPKMADIVIKAMEHSDGYLARKYGDRWMVKALKRGLHNRPLKREELPVWYYLKMTIVKPILSFSWFNFCRNAPIQNSNQDTDTGSMKVKTFETSIIRDS